MWMGTLVPEVASGLIEKGLQWKEEKVQILTRSHEGSESVVMISIVEYNYGLAQ